MTGGIPSSKPDRRSMPASLPVATIPARALQTSPSAQVTRTPSSPPSIRATRTGAANHAPPSTAQRRIVSSRARRRTTRHASAAPSGGCKGISNEPPAGPTTSRRATASASGRIDSSKPSSVSTATARGVSASPQVFSRGNSLRSSSATSKPARASKPAASAPPGPAPATTMSDCRPIAARIYESDRRLLSPRTLRYNAPS